MGRWIVGVDGCPGGWVAALMDADAPDSVHVRVVSSFADVLAADTPPVLVAVDMPIGLPERIDGSGRGPEQAVRPMLGARQSSVFSIPSRAAVYAEPGPFGGLDAMYAAHRRASDIARQTSSPPKGISIQAFHLFPKIREIDILLRADTALRQRVYEVHPELVFRLIKGDGPLDTPKKVKGSAHGPGLAERRALLVQAGLPQGHVEAAPPRGAGADDLLDALAALVGARRILTGEARPWPDPPPRDAHGLPMAIWA